MTIPVAEVAYAAWRRPTQKDHPSGHPELFSNLVKTQAGSRRPFFATTRITVTRAITPVIVQKMAAVSSRGSHLLPREETALQRRVMPMKRRMVFHASSPYAGSPPLFSKTLMQEMMNVVLPKVTDSVIVMLPTT